NACAATSTTGNNPPVVTVTPTLTSPANTPFTLTGSATDPDGDALTYQWEEIDPGSGSGGNWNSGNKPFFRSYAPVTSPSRSFPSAAVITSGNLQGTRGEYVPTTAQVLKFRLTVRDNKMGGGGVCTATTQVTITPNDVGVKQYTSDHFAISFYPNPFSGVIKVEIAGKASLSPENTSLKVYDVLGNVVKTEKLKISDNYSESIDLSNLANGSYMIEVTDGQQRSVTRVVKM
ncbi:MAG: T9SS type A sorting domain-containing protein, partial [Bacteroidia bacterium]|nr:T9SS type A sorting domain-containing protein [Bacteroidia bacterium]